MKTHTHLLPTTWIFNDKERKSFYSGVGSVSTVETLKPPTIPRNNDSIQSFSHQKVDLTSNLSGPPEQSVSLMVGVGSQRLSSPSS